MKLCNVKHYE